MNSTIESPPGWGEDKLTEFLDIARENQFATFANKRLAIRRLIEVDECFLSAIPSRMSTDSFPSEMLLIRAHSAYRAAATHALAGFSTELYPLLRLMLEQGGYALLIHRKPGLANVWLNRHESDDNRQNIPKSFSVKRIKQVLAESNELLRNYFQLLYERTIDFGAHPNEFSVTGSFRLVEQDNQTHIKPIVLHGNGLVLDHSLLNVTQVGICVLSIFREIFQERFEVSGTASKMRSLLQEL